VRRVLAAIAALAVGVSGLVVAIIVLADGDSDRSGAGGLFGPGTAIGDGFTVAEGATLLGSRFPEVSSIYRGTPRLGWSAVLLVDGDPGQVLRAYVAQSEAQGMRTQILGGACFRTGRLIQCTLSREAGPLDAPAGHRLYVKLLRSQSGVPGPFASHLLLQYEQWGDPSLLPQETVTSTPDVSDPVAGVSFGPPPQQPGRATTGEPIIDPRYGPRDRGVITVEDGSQLLAPPAPEVCTTGGYQGVFRVTGDPRDVVERYAQQFTEKLGPGEQGFQGEVRAVKRDGFDVLEATWGQSGGGGVKALAVTLPDGDSYLTIERCAD
jgi:hypothetical protein